MGNYSDPNWGIILDLTGELSWPQVGNKAGPRQLPNFGIKSLYEVEDRLGELGLRMSPPTASVWYKKKPNGQENPAPTVVSSRELTSREESSTTTRSVTPTVINSKEPTYNVLYSMRRQENLATTIKSKSRKSKKS